MSIEDSFFNPTNNSVLNLDNIGGGSNSKSNEFKPNPAKGANGVFEAVIRFVMNPNDPNKCVVGKNTVYLEHPSTHVKREIDCPSTVGLPDPIQNTFFSLRNSSSGILKENSKMFGRRARYATVIQVLSCKSDPSLVNKFLVWRYGFKIFEKIKAEQEPPMGTPHNPWNLFTGRPMSIIVKNVGGYTNYDSCSFFDLAMPQSALRMVKTDASGQQQVFGITPETCSTPEGKKMVLEYVKENYPDLSYCEYQPWTDETNNFVNDCIRVYTNVEATIQAQKAAMQSATPVNMPYGNGGQVAPQANAMNGGMQMPQTSANPMMGGAQPQVQPMAQPTMGGMQMPTMGATSVPNVNTTGSFNGDNLNGDINAMINGGAQAPSQAPSSNGGSENMSLDDILGGQML